MAAHENHEVVAKTELDLETEMAVAMFHKLRNDYINNFNAAKNGDIVSLSEYCAHEAHRMIRGKEKINGVEITYKQFFVIIDEAICF